MAANWNLYFAGYQKPHGGAYFGSDRERYDCQLVLTEQEKAPILVYVDTEPAGRSYTLNIVARTSVRLNGAYHLKLGGANAVVGGVKGLCREAGGRKRLWLPGRDPQPFRDHQQQALYQTGAGGSGLSERPDGAEEGLCGDSPHPPGRRLAHGRDRAGQL